MKDENLKNKTWHEKHQAGLSIGQRVADGLAKGFSRHSCPPLADKTPAGIHSRFHGWTPAFAGVTILLLGWALRGLGRVNM